MSNEELTKNVNKEILHLIRKTKVDALYAMKSHYNAAERLKRYTFWLGSSVVVLTVVVGSSIFATVSKSPSTNWRIGAGLLVLASGVLSALQTFLRFSESSALHKTAGDNFRVIFKKSQEIEHTYLGETITKEEASKNISGLRDQADIFSRQSLAPSNADYRKTRAGIADKEAEYTQKELSET